MNTNESQNHEVESRELVAVFAGFLAFHRILSPSICFRVWSKIDDAVKKTFTAHQKVPILIIILDEKLLRLRNSNHDMWNLFLDLINVLGYQQKADSDRYLTIYRGEK
jgi:hypothetical protein